MTLTPIETTIETPEVLTLRTEGDGLADMAESLVVTEATMNDASDLLAWIATNKKRLEAQRVSLVKPLNDHVKFINGQFKGWMAPLESADQAVRGKVLTYKREQARIADEAKAAEEKRIRAEQALLAEEAETTGVPLAPAPPPMAATLPSPPAKTTRSALGTTTVKKVWQYEITDPTAVPREYLAVDEKKIAAVVRAGIRSIAGVRIFETEQLAVRSR